MYLYNWLERVSFNYNIPDIKADRNRMLAETWNNMILRRKASMLNPLWWYNSTPSSIQTSWHSEFAVSSCKNVPFWLLLVVGAWQSAVWVTRHSWITLHQTELSQMYLHKVLPSDHGRKSRGGRGGHVPPTILKVGDTISNVPPPHVFGVVRLFIEMRTLFIIVSRRCFFFCLSARILNKIPCGNNVAPRKVCAVKITAIPIELHWLRIRNPYWRSV